MTAIKFQNPPAPSRGRGKSHETQQIITALKARPGEWALIKENVASANGTTWNKREGFEARIVGIGKPKGKYDIYVRWVGEAQ